MTNIYFFETKETHHIARSHDFVTLTAPHRFLKIPENTFSLKAIKGSLELPVNAPLLELAH